MRGVRAVWAVWAGSGGSRGVRGRAGGVGAVRAVGAEGFGHALEACIIRTFSVQQPCGGRGFGHWRPVRTFYLQQ